jgi:hypothetical protein
MKRLFLLGLMSIVGSLTFAQAFQYPMGIPDGPDTSYEQIPIKAPLVSSLYKDIGGSASLRKYAPFPGNQGQYGTCVAWATGYCARTIVEAKRYGWLDRNKITQEAFATGFIYRITAPYQMDCNGAFPSDALENMKNVGIPKMTDYNIQCPQAPIPQNVYSLAAKYKIEGYVRLWSEGMNYTDKERIEMVKKSISEGNPVVIAMLCPQSFQGIGPSGLWQPAEDPNNIPAWMHGRHALCAIGYDDSKFGGAFEIQNSWSTQWGAQGYCWIPYQAFSDFVYQAFELLSFKDQNIEEKEINLAGALRFETDKGKGMKATLSNGVYKIAGNYESGDRFRIYIKNTQPAYVYCFATDPNYESSTVFPTDPGISPALTYRQNEVALPDEKHHIRFEGDPGKEYMTVIFSDHLLNVSDLQNSLAQNQGTFIQRLRKAMGLALIPDNEMTYNPDGTIGFTAKSKKGNTAVLVVEFNHVD